MCSQAPTVPMQSVRLGGGAFGFAFPKNRFILAAKKTQTLEQNQKRKQRQHRLGLDFRLPVRKRTVPPGVSRCLCRVFSSAFSGEEELQEIGGAG